MAKAATSGTDSKPKRTRTAPVKDDGWGLYQDRKKTSARRLGRPLTANGGSFTGEDYEIEVEGGERQLMTKEEFERRFEPAVKKRERATA